MNTSVTIEAVRNGDSGQFGELVRANLRAVYAVAYAHCRNAADAEDVAQDSFVTAFERLDTLRDPEKFEGWLVTITRNAAKRLCKRRGRNDAEPISTELPASTDLVREASRNEIHSLLHDGVHRLSLKYREVILLHYFAGHSTKEIAAALDISQAAVLKRLERGRDQLGEALLSRYRDTFAPDDDFEQRASKILGVVVAAVPTWQGRTGMSALSLSTGLKLGATIFLIAALIMAWVAQPGTPPEAADNSERSAAIAPAEPGLEGDRTQIAELNTSARTSQDSGEAAQPSPHAQGEGAPSETPEPDLDQLVDAVFEDIHVAELLAIVAEKHELDIPIHLDSKSIGYPYRYDYLDGRLPHIQPPPNGTPVLPYVTDGMLESVNLQDVTVLEALDTICASLGLAVLSEPGFIWISTPELIAAENRVEPDSRYEGYDDEALLETIIDAQYDEVHISDLAELASDELGITIAWDFGVIQPKNYPAIFPEIESYPAKTMSHGIIAYTNLKDIQLRDAFTSVLRPLGLTYEVVNGCILISTRDQLMRDKLFWDYDYETEDANRLETKVGVIFMDIHVANFMDVLADTYELKVMVDQRVILPPKYTDADHAFHYGAPRSIDGTADASSLVTDGMIRHISLRNIPLGDLLRVVSDQLDIGYEVKDGKVILTARRLVHSDVHGEVSPVPLAQFAEQIRKIRITRNQPEDAVIE